MGARLERVSLIAGFGLAIVGAIGAQTYLAPATSRRHALAQGLDATWARLKIIRGAQALLGLLESGDGLVYLVPADFGRDVAGANAVAEVGLRAIHGRHDMARNYFAQVASAGEVDFAEANRRYDELVAAETAQWTLARYTATNRYPADLSMKVGADRWPLEISVAKQERALRAARAQERWRAGVLAMIEAAGAAILFVMAIVAAREEPAPASLDDAARIMAAALAEARRRLDAQRAPAERPT